eukprot:g1595.t1
MRKSELDAMGFENGRITGFKPRFRSIDDDWERYVEALGELANRGIVKRQAGKSLYDAYCTDLFDWLTEFYFSQGLIDQVEAHYTPSGEVPFGPIHAAHLKVLDRLTNMGEGVRVRRIWRAHAGHLKGQFWWYIQERNAGFRPSKFVQASEERQRRDYEQLIGRIPEMKKDLLGILLDHRAAAAIAGAGDTELARIDADIAAVENERRPGPDGKPDPRKMDEDLFWQLIEEGLVDQPLGERLDTLLDRLAALKPAAIREFSKILHTLEARAYRTDIWALAYLLQGGCSDDAFEEFRGWLILQGREVFEAALEDPDNFDVTLYTGPAGGTDSLYDAAAIAYDLRQGKAMKPVKLPKMVLSGPDLEEEDFAAALPRIARLVAI